jgi:hypothetical protein
MVISAIVRVGHCVGEALAIQLPLVQFGSAGLCFCPSFLSLTFTKATQDLRPKGFAKKKNPDNTSRPSSPVQ